MSFGEDGRPGHFVREREVVEGLEIVEQSEREDALECWLRVEVVLKTEPAGDVAERVDDRVRCGVWGESEDGMFASLRTTMRVKCSFLRDRQLET